MNTQSRRTWLNQKSLQRKGKKVNVAALTKKRWTHNSTVKMQPHFYKYDEFYYSYYDNNQDDHEYEEDDSDTSNEFVNNYEPNAVGDDYDDDNSLEPVFFDRFESTQMPDQYKYIPITVEDIQKLALSLPAETKTILGISSDCTLVNNALSLIESLLVKVYRAKGRNLNKQSEFCKKNECFKVHEKYIYGKISTLIDNGSLVLNGKQDANRFKSLFGNITSMLKDELQKKVDT